ncbi:MAG: hypothetical protein K2K06_02270, partial [Oscillospiraceae bacterium]|nr:hypothetical protein [Oscillospiraceae bacterium]
VQQAFLIAHELSHFNISKNLNHQIRGLTSEQKILNMIYDYIKVKNPELAFFMTDLINDKNMIEECLCDSIGVMQAIDVGLKVGKLDIVESGIAITMALMHQYIVSIIQDTVKFEGDMTYERCQNLFNFRLLHIKEIVSQYIRKIKFQEEKRYRVQIDDIHNKWINKIYHPILLLLVDCNNLLNNKLNTLTMTSEELKNARITLKRIYRP